MLLNSNRYSLYVIFTMGVYNKWKPYLYSNYVILWCKSSFVTCSESAKIKLLIARCCSLHMSLTMTTFDGTTL